MNFKDFYNKIIFLALKGPFILTIKGKKKKVKAIAEYKSIHDLCYLKFIFDDKSFLYVVFKDEEVYYSDNYTIDTGIKDEEIGNSEVIKYNGKTYYLDNKGDYQFVKRLYFGDILDIEGEVKFSDYLPKKGNDFLSLGWISYNNKRADINPEKIGLDEINFN